MVDTIRTLPELLAIWADNTSGDVDAQAGRDLIVSQSWPNMNAATELTISSGAITVTQDHHKLRGEGGLDDVLSTINGGVDSKFFVLENQSFAGDITVNDSGNIIPFPGEFKMSSVGGWALCKYVASLTKVIAIDMRLYARDLISEIGSTVASAQGEQLVINQILRLQGGEVQCINDELTDAISPLILVSPETGTTDDVRGMTVQGGMQGGQTFILRSHEPGIESFTVYHNDLAATAGTRFFIKGDADAPLANQDLILVVYNQELDALNGGWMAAPLGRQAAFVDPSTATAQQVAQALIDAGLMAAS